MYEDSVFWLQALREFEKLVSAIATIADLSEISAWNTTLFLFFPSANWWGAYCMFKLTNNWHAYLINLVDFSTTWPMVNISQLYSVAPETSFPLHQVFAPNNAHALVLKLK